VESLKQCFMESSLESLYFRTVLWTPWDSVEAPHGPSTWGVSGGTIWKTLVGKCPVMESPQTLNGVSMGVSHGGPCRLYVRVLCGLVDLHGTP